MSDVWIRLIHLTPRLDLNGSFEIDRPEWKEETVEQTDRLGKARQDKLGRRWNGRGWIYICLYADEERQRLAGFVCIPVYIESSRSYCGHYRSRSQHVVWSFFFFPLHPRHLEKPTLLIRSCNPYDLLFRPSFCISCLLLDIPTSSINQVSRKNHIQVCWSDSFFFNFTVPGKNQFCLRSW